MQLTDTGITAIRDSAECRRELMYQLEITQTTIYRYLDENKPNGKLTTALALRIIKETTGLTDKQILTSSKVNV